MKTREAITRTWKALVEVEYYFKDGIPKQLATAVSFSGEDAIPIHTAQSTLRQCEPFLPSELKNTSEEVLLTAFTQFNIFIDALKKVTASKDDAQRQIATKEANQQLQMSLDAYREKLSMLGKIIPPDIGNAVNQSISISGSVSGQLNIAGTTISAPSMNMTLSELERKIDESNDASKEDAKSKLRSLLKHPLVVKILGGAIGGVIG